MAELNGKTVVITGAARGIGAECARLLSERGANVVLSGLEPELLHDLAGSLPGQSLAVEADVLSWEDLERVFSSAQERFGSVDIVLANAGISPIAKAEQIDPELFEKTIGINLLGAWRTARVAMPYLKQSRGYLLAIASIAATLHIPGGSHYSASKAGVEAFCNALRIELRSSGVDVGVAYFGFISTDMVNIPAESGQIRGLSRSGFNPLSRVYPVSRAANALVNGMTSRSRRVVFPGTLWPLLLLPAVAQRLVERRYRSR